LTAEEQTLLQTKPADLNDEQRLVRRKLQNKLASSISRSKKRETFSALATTSADLSSNLESAQATIKLLRGQVNTLLCVVQKLGGLGPTYPKNCSLKTSAFRYNINNTDFTPASVSINLQQLGLVAQESTRKLSPSTRTRPSAHTYNLKVEDEEIDEDDEQFERYSVAPSLNNSRKSRQTVPSIEATSDDESDDTELLQRNLASNNNTKQYAHPIRRSSRRLVAPVLTQDSDRDSECEHHGSKLTKSSQKLSGPTKRSRGKLFTYAEDQNLQPTNRPTPHTDYSNSNSNQHHCNQHRCNQHHCHSESTIPLTSHPIEPLFPTSNLPCSEHSGFPSFSTSVLNQPAMFSPHFSPFNFPSSEPLSPYTASISPPSTVQLPLSPQLSPHLPPSCQFLNEGLNR
jgi:hypothetical protein